MKQETYKKEPKLNVFDKYEGTIFINRFDDVL